MKAKHLEELTRELKRQNDILEAVAESMFHANNHISDAAYVSLLEKRGVAKANGEVDNVGGISQRILQARKLHRQNIRERLQKQESPPKKFEEF